MLLITAKNNPKSTQNCEKSSCYECMHTEKLKRTLSLATTHTKVTNSGNSEVW